jgi:hypothetical protein
MFDTERAVLDKQRPNNKTGKGRSAEMGLVSTGMNSHRLQPMVWCGEKVNYKGFSRNSVNNYILSN